MLLANLLFKMYKTVNRQYKRNILHFYTTVKQIAVSCSRSKEKLANTSTGTTHTLQKIQLLPFEGHKRDILHFYTTVKQIAVSCSRSKEKLANTSTGTTHTLQKIQLLPFEGHKRDILHFYTTVKQIAVSCSRSKEKLANTSTGTTHTLQKKYNFCPLKGTKPQLQHDKTKKISLQTK